MEKATHYCYSSFHKELDRAEENPHITMIYLNGKEQEYTCACSNKGQVPVCSMNDTAYLGFIKEAS